MAVSNAIEAIYRWLPNQLTLDNGDTFTVRKRDGLEDDDEPEKPYFEIEPENQNYRGRSLRGKWKRQTENQTDTFTYDATKDIYEVEQKDIDTVNAVEGTLNGAAHTFTEGTDYQVISTDTNDFDNAIEWLDGGDTPDNGTDFTVDYDYILVAPTRNSYGRIEFRLWIITEEVRSSHSEATKDYAKTDLAWELGDALLDWLDLRSGAGLDIRGSNELKFDGYQEFGGWATHKGENVATYKVDLFLNRRRVATGQGTERIGDAQLRDSDGDVDEVEAEI